MSEKSPLLKAFKAAQAKVDKMNLRERLLVFATGLMLLGSIWYLGLMEPLSKQIKNDRNEITAVQQRINSINESLEIQARAASGGTIGYQEQFALIQRRLEELNDKLGGYTAELIGPGEMARVLQGVLKEQSNLRLIHIQNLSPVPVAATDATDAIFYKHGLEIEFEGGYFACLEYLKEIEALPWRLYFQILELEVIKYPQNRIRLEVSTLSPHEEWIGA
jgi:MSHA biogenesis protein MshJ